MKITTHFSKRPKRYLGLSIVLFVLTVMMQLMHLVNVKQAAPVAALDSVAPAFSKLVAYDPLKYGPQITERLSFRCSTQLPKPEELPQLRAMNWTFTRFVLYYNLDKFLETYFEHFDGSPRILDAGGSRFLLKYRRRIDLQRTVYPDVDLHGTPYEDNSFDMIAADQVLEHTLFPQLIAVEMHRILRPGGLAIITTCGANPNHQSDPYHDLWRYQTDGLLMLSMPFTKVLQCGSWGTTEALFTRFKLGMLSANETAAFENFFSEQVTRRDFKTQWMTWIIMQK